jgi:hypothetical protein
MIGNRTSVNLKKLSTVQAKEGTLEYVYACLSLSRHLFDVIRQYKKTKTNHSDSLKIERFEDENLPSTSKKGGGYS